MKEHNSSWPRTFALKIVQCRQSWKPTDAIIRLDLAATCICGSDLWPYRGLNDVTAPMAMGHEYCGFVEEVGSAVTTVRPGQFLVGSFCLSDEHARVAASAFSPLAQQREFMTGAGPVRARFRSPTARLLRFDKLLDDLIPSLLRPRTCSGAGCVRGRSSMHETRA